MRNQRVALGLGSNLENPLAKLRQALHFIKQSSSLKVLEVSSLYESDALLPENAQLNWNKKYLNAVILCEMQHNISAESLLAELKKIEFEMGRTQAERWAPRLIDIDILYWDRPEYKSQVVQVPHPRLSERPFALLPLMEVWSDVELQKPDWAQDHIVDKPFATKKSQNSFWPQFVGILNITADSFSDGGKFLNSDSLLQQYEKLISQGAEIIDLGAESTRPQAQAISPQEERQNLDWALSCIAQSQYKAKISIDTRKAEVVKSLLEKHKIDFLNDVTGFTDLKMQEVLKASNLPAFVMHSLDVPPRADQTLDPQINPCRQLKDWWSNHSQSLSAKGIKIEKLIFDVGIGFGKTKEQSFYILNHLQELNEVRNDFMLGYSRKSFLSLISDREASQRDLETSLITQKINLAFTQYLRVHDVESQKTALRARLLQ